jgi:hypothetical protein
LVVTERSNLELLRDEIEFQMSGKVSDESAASLGKWVGAKQSSPGTASPGLARHWIATPLRDSQ